MKHEYVTLICTNYLIKSTLTDTDTDKDLF